MPFSHLSETSDPSSQAVVRNDALRRIAVLIPVWQPEPRLLELVSALHLHGFKVLIVVDDGSSPQAADIFENLTRSPLVEVLHHDCNRGKGAALKTGFQHVLAQHPQLLGVVTFDADGQHVPADAARVASRLLDSLATPILGSREFSSSVPLRSRIGNLLTREVFRLLIGVRLSDTQSGLRALPRKFLPALLKLPGERYDYEMSMLAALCRGGHIPLEIPIATVYLENNRHSHFDPLWDSLRIYYALLGTRAAARPSTEGQARP